MWGVWSVACGVKSESDYIKIVKTKASNLFSHRPHTTDDRPQVNAKP